MPLKDRLAELRSVRNFTNKLFLVLFISNTNAFNDERMHLYSMCYGIISILMILVNFFSISLLALLNKYL